MTRLSISPPIRRAAFWAGLVIYAAASGVGAGGNGAQGGGDGPPLHSAAAPAKTIHRILLVNRPDIYATPAWDAARHPTDWTAGRRLQMAESPPGAPAAWIRLAGSSSKGWLPAVWLAPEPQAIDPDSTAAIGSIMIDARHGLPPEYAPDDLVPVGPGCDDEVDYRLRKAAAKALASMIEAARRDGVRLLVVSAYRPWARQQILYERRVRQDPAQNTIAMPGHSEHQLGTAVDLTDGVEEHLLRESFGDSPAGRWLREKAWIYGFAVSFTRHNHAQTGIAPEPWHYRYWGIARARSRHLAALGESPAARSGGR
ncbi:MAG: M15 family metallopeptidase [bacterium]|nr:M15 family metallopeptidase [bacterium]